MASGQQDKNKKFRPGVRVSEHPQTPLLLSQKTFRKVNILIGRDPAQVRFTEQFLNQQAQTVERLKDEDVLGKEGLFIVESPRALDLSPATLNAVGLWSLDPLAQGTAGTNAIVRFASQILNIEKLDKTQLQRVSDVLADDDIEDVRAAIWSAVWLLTGPPLPEKKIWTQPWDDPVGWLPPDVDPGYRLNTLYWDLLGYTFTLRDEEVNIRNANAPISPKKLNYLKSLKLDLRKVEQSFYELSQWKSLKSDPYICALKLRIIWKSSNK